MLVLETVSSSRSRAHSTYIYRECKYFVQAHIHKGKQDFQSLVLCCDSVYEDKECQPSIWHTQLYFGKNSRAKWTRPDFLVDSTQGSEKACAMPPLYPHRIVQRRQCQAAFTYGPILGSSREVESSTLRSTLTARICFAVADATS